MTADMPRATRTVGSLRDTIAGLVLVALAVSFTAGAVQAQADPSDRSTADLLDALQIDQGDLAWDTAPAERGGRRRALLVGANAYRDDPLLDLPKVPKLLDDLRATLLDERIGFDRVELVTGELVRPEIVEEKLAALTDDLAGPDNHLLVLWVGHGFNDGSGREILFTYRSRAGTTSSDNSALPYDELVGWIARARTHVHDAGGDLSTSMLLDACRQDSLGTPGKIRDHVPVLDVEAFSAPLGSPAPGGANVEPLWTRALQRALAGTRTSRVSLRDALVTAQGDVLKQSAGRVEPEIATGERDVLLADHDDLTLSVRVIDRFTGREIEGAQVRLNNDEHAAPATFAGLARSPDGYALMVRAEGYFWRAEEIPLERAQQGGLLTVPLAPEFVALVGSVRIDGAGVAKVSVSGAFPGLIDGWHTTSSTLDRAGGFLLELPPVQGERELVIDVNGREARRRAFDIATMPATVVDVAGTRVRVLDFGANVVSPRAAVEVGGGVQAAVVGDLIDVRFDFSSLTSDDFTDSRGYSLYSTVNRYSDRGEYGKAASDLDALLSQRKVREAANARVDALRHELRVAQGMSAAAPLQSTGRLDEALAKLDVDDLRDDSRVRLVIGSWLLADARDAHVAQRFSDAEARLLRAQQLDPEQQGLGDQLTRIREDHLAHAFEQALEDGSWPALRDLMATLETKQHPGLAEWRARVDDEDITPASRRAYARAVNALGAGDLDQALTAYDEALAGGCNAHYRGLIAPQRAAIRDQLFDRHVKAGAEREEAKDVPGALAEYVAASSFDRIVASRVERLLATPGLDAATTERIERIQRDFRDGQTLTDAQALLDARAALEAGRLDDAAAAVARVSDPTTPDIQAVATDIGEAAALRLDEALGRESLDEAARLFAMARALPGADAERLGTLKATLDRKQSEAEAAAAAAAAEAAAEEEAQRVARTAALFDRQAYARLSFADIEALRREVEAAWPAAFSDLTFVRVERFSIGGLSHTINIYRHGQSAIELALIPGGSFRMGSPENESGRSHYESPPHDVTVQPFLMARTECTQRQWHTVMGTKPSSSYHGPDDPIEKLSWDDVQPFEQKTGLTLPSEAQWEYACRSGTTTAIPGSDLGQIAWFEDNSDTSSWFEDSNARLHPVAQKAPNAFGLYDMLGNVWEYCENRQFRGGCWHSDAQECRSAYRGTATGTSFGFRPIRLITE